MLKASIKNIFILNNNTTKVIELHTLLKKNNFESKLVSLKSLNRLIKLNIPGIIILPKEYLSLIKDQDIKTQQNPILYLKEFNDNSDIFLQYNIYDIITFPYSETEVVHRITSTLQFYLQHYVNNRIDNVFQECYISISEDKKITDISKTFEQTFSMDKESLIGKDIKEIFQNKNDYNTFIENIESQGCIKDLLISIQDSDGFVYWVELSGAFRFNDSGSFIGIDAIVRDITESKIAENDREYLMEQIKEEMHRTELATEELNKFLYAVDEHTLISVTDIKGKIIYVNEKFCDVTNFTKEELLGKSHSIINSNYHDNFFWKNLWDTILAGKVWKGEIMNFSKDKTMFWEQTTIVPFKDKEGNLEKFVSLRTDITELKKKEEEIKARELKFNTLFESSSDTVILMEGEKIKDCNFATLQMFGIPSINFLLKEDILSLSPETQPNNQKSKDEFQKHFAFAQINGNCRFEWLFIDKLERTFFAEVIIDQMPFGGESHYQVVIRDISVRKKAEEELIEAKNLAEKTTQEKANFLSVMSHEIRTPINAVIGLSHLLLDNNPREDQMRNLETLKFSSKNLLALINDILDFSKIEAGKVEFEEIDFNLYENIDNLASTFDFKVKETNVKLITEIDNSIPTDLLGDPSRLNQILTNLLSNAFKFTSEGQIIIKVTNEIANDTDIRIKFEVKDSGIGINEDKIEYIFESFSQEKKETSRKYGGTGLGLSITKKLIELQGGVIKVKSEVGKGSNFYFSLDFKISNQVNLSLKPKNEILDLSGIKLLLVEDNPFNILVVNQFLSKWGIEITHAKNGLEAFTIAKDNDFDIILMDLQMPEMDGYESTLRIRQLKSEKHTNTPIIALTAETFSEVKDRVYAAGMNDYITKPFNPIELNHKIHQYTNQLISSNK